MSNKSKNPTSNDVARLAGVSQATVSRVLSGKGYTKEDTKQKVMDAIAQLNYRPNAYARTLNNSRANLIGILLPSANYPIYLELLNHLVQACKAKGYTALLIPGELNQGESYSITNLLQYKVDGIITASAHHKTNLYYECNLLGLPVVQVMRVDVESDCSYAASDNYGAGELAASEMLKRNGQDFLYITGHLPSKTNDDRFSGFASEIENELGHRPESLPTHFDYDVCKSFIRKRIKQKGVPDSVLCATDVIAYAFMDVVRFEFGYKIPQDIQVIGYDDLDQSSWSCYELTSFRQNIKRLSNEAVSFLDQQISGQTDKIFNVNVSAKFIERGTLRLPT
ncbi:LacI family DNA-binding transcriptional regulator [Vibrio crassostreae]|uniref:LacI family DNA-binding transcriptional regulator n=1 Tax=Vibrio crassostreae TaxID=246167 RepID=UPI0010526329|nr:LacI family DNA-binding transcriptional regulator [Vibrio crassostreae]TCO02289.1 LacI family transcriptional regulator [Vibrio crassostreae]CAK1975386.1 LacI family transcriptional regulator [Vibrio crassostreae]CAK1986061.1 LacI family transcriptional regulator [Vibrio crassostreae]CAK2093293.1 LacI family transcriptional regulator [Vibrio crassostreae]CAK2165567.1 LacI family transcriptional regulator [Vibrio crassostreae]